MMEKIFTMSQKELTVYHTINKTEKEGLKQVKAAELLGISDRHYRRLVKAYREQGLEGLVSKKRGKPSNNRTKPEVRKKVVAKLKRKYRECGPTFAWEKLLQEGINLSKETIRKIMLEEGLWEPRRKKRQRPHQRRNRRDNEGELIQVDGSTHAWLEKRGPKCCLLGFIDDATSKIKHLRFVKSETTKDYFIAIEEYIRKHGKPRSYYTDRSTVFRVNNDKEGYRKRGLTQVGRALKELDIELICANSPQAKGRIERLFGTLQDRLVKELRLKNINSIKEANKYLEEYIEKHNALFAVQPAEPEDVHKPVDEKQIKQALCFKEDRVLSKNLELSYNSRIFQIQTEEQGYTLRGTKVTVKEDLKGKLRIEYQGKELKYKELLVKDRQGRVANKKEILLGMTKKDPRCACAEPREAARR